MRVIALERGARGVVKLGLDPGSLFSFRLAYLPESGAPSPRPADPGDPAESGSGAEGILAALSEAFASGKLLEGPEWEERLAAIARAQDLYAIEKAALAILARREHSRAELERKLAKKELPPADARIVLGRLEEEGLLSNERFAEAWLRSRLRLHPEGEASLRAGLRAKGVEKPIIRSELDSGREEILKGLERLARRVLDSETRKASRKGEETPDRREILKRCYAKLRARGYSHADAKKALGDLSGSPLSIDEGDDST